MFSPAQVRRELWEFGMTTALHITVLSLGSVDSVGPKQWKNKLGVGLYTEIFIMLQVHVLVGIAI